MQWFRGDIKWVPPKITRHPSAEQLEAFLSTEKMYAYDIETDALECLDANIRCIAISTADEAMVVGFRSNSVHKSVTKLFTDFYSEEDARAVFTVLKDFFENGKIAKLGHNSGYYDSLVLRQRAGIEVINQVDTMMMHRVVEPELPHSLAYVTSMNTIAPAWKVSRDGRKLALGGGERRRAPRLLRVRRSAHVSML